MDGAPGDKDPVEWRDELPWTEVRLARVTVLETPVLLGCPVVRLVTGEVRMAVTPTVEEKRLDGGIRVVRVVDWEVVDREERVWEMGVLGVVLGKEGTMLVLPRGPGVRSRGGVGDREEGEKAGVGGEDTEDSVGVEASGDETKEEKETTLAVPGECRELEV